MRLLITKLLDKGAQILTKCIQTKIIIFIQIHLPFTLIGIHQSRQSAGNVKSNVNNINVDNDIISQTFRTSVRFLKRNNDENKTVNGTYSRLYSSKLFMSQFKYQAPECASNRNNRKRSQKVECAPSSGWIRGAVLVVEKSPFCGLRLLDCRMAYYHTTLPFCGVNPQKNIPSH